MVNNMYYINYFFIMSFFGHFIESVFFSSKGSGILFSYWTPVYGIGCIIILIIYKYINKRNMSRFCKFITLFLFSSIVLASIEALGGYLIKSIFNKELWSYTNHKFNIGKYTSLEMAFIWGLGSIIFIHLIKPIADNVIKKIPKLFSLVCISLFIIDIITTLIIKS